MIIPKERIVSMCGNRIYGPHAFSSGVCIFCGTLYGISNLGECCHSNLRGVEFEFKISGHVDRRDTVEVDGKKYSLVTAGFDGKTSDCVGLEIEERDIADTR